MKLEGLRQTIKEELAKVLNENTFKKGDTVIPNKGPHKGIPHEVIAVLDGGAYNIKPKNLKASEIKYKLGAARATQSDLESDSLEEITGADPNKPRYNVSGLKENSINGILGMLKDEPALIGNMEVKKALMTCLKQLDLEVLQNLNTVVQQQSGKKFPPAGPSTSQNPYDEPASRGYMGAKYRGD